MCPHQADARDGPSESSGVTNWLLLAGNRLVIAGGLVLLVFLCLVGVGVTFGTAVFRAHSPVYFLFSSLLTGNLTVLTVVVSINQLVLSRELGEPGELRTRIEETLDYRSTVESVAGTPVSPSSPGKFLRFLHETIAEQGEKLDERATAATDSDLQDRLESLSRSLVRDARRVNRTLDDQQGRIFAVVAATLTTNHADQIHDITEIQRTHADALSETTRTQLERIERTLLQIDVGRKYFKTVYVQKELAYLSRILLYVGVPAIVGSGFVLLLYNAATTANVPSSVLAPAVAGAFALGVTPLALLVAFVLRLAWVAQQTATIVPFTSTTEYRP
ncbi:hypothetical protein ACFR9U_13180 [Halorientalis brevis]|uniref:DUF4239 domain-containing protein n=1 Tax=Halorientalis brevis TaxID=1126241 RepID=A0ABD6CEE9_9EURY|nr:hypothetical protein [Halorientalis brevis]